jgi:hypothetical protein
MAVDWGWRFFVFLFLFLLLYLFAVRQEGQVGSWPSQKFIGLDDERHGRDKETDLWQLAARGFDKGESGQGRLGRSSQSVQGTYAG